MLQSYNIVHIHFAVPLCYTTTNCAGSTVNRYDISYSDCCTKFGGISYDLAGLCHPCPSISKYILLQFKLFLDVYNYVRRFGCCYSGY